MSQRNYRISLKVPLGTRKGTMTINEKDEMVNGYLILMNKTNSFTGTLSKDGKLNLNGVIKTLVDVVSYKATGLISGSSILLSLKTDHNTCLSLLGEEINIDEKVL